MGIWSMHYIGMLAFSLPITVDYDWPTVAASLLCAIFASGVALFVVSRPRRSQVPVKTPVHPLGLSHHPWPLPKALGLLRSSCRPGSRWGSGGDVWDSGRKSGMEKFLIEVVKPSRYHAKTLQSPLRYLAFIVSVALFGAFQAAQAA